MPVKEHRASDYLKTPQDIAAFLNAVIEEFDGRDASGCIAVGCCRGRFGHPSRSPPVVDESFSPRGGGSGRRFRTRTPSRRRPRGPLPRLVGEQRSPARYGYQDRRCLRSKDSVCGSTRYRPDPDLENVTADAPLFRTAFGRSGRPEVGRPTHRTSGVNLSCLATKPRTEPVPVREESPRLVRSTTAGPRCGRFRPGGPGRSGLSTRRCHCCRPAPCRRPSRTPAACRRGNRRGSAAR